MVGTRAGQGFPSSSLENTSARLCGEVVDKRYSFTHNRHQINPPHFLGHPEE
jgi:hypothetical protein